MPVLSCRPGGRASSIAGHADGGPRRSTVHGMRLGAVGSLAFLRPVVIVRSALWPCVAAKGEGRGAAEGRGPSSRGCWGPSPWGQGGKGRGWGGGGGLKTVRCVWGGGGGLDPPSGRLWHGTCTAAHETDAPAVADTRPSVLANKMAADGGSVSGHRRGSTGRLTLTGNRGGVVV